MNLYLSNEMKIFLKVKPSSKVEKVEKIAENIFTVWVKKPAKENQANDAMIKTLAKYFGISRSNIKIVSGKTAKQKIIEIIQYHE